jgi:hypothetical protein
MLKIECESASADEPLIFIIWVRPGLVVIASRFFSAMADGLKRRILMDVFFYVRLCSDNTFFPFLLLLSTQPPPYSWIFDV